MCHVSLGKQLTGRGGGGEGDKTQLTTPKHPEITQTLLFSCLVLTLLEALTFRTVRSHWDPTQNIRPKPDYRYIQNQCTH
jgi:hypothetical protein